MPWGPRESVTSSQVAAARRQGANDAAQAMAAAQAAQAAAAAALPADAPVVNTVNGETGEVTVPATAARVVLIQLPLLTIGTTTETVTWNTPMPSASYGVLPALALPTGSIGGLTATVVAGSTTAAGCKVALKATVAVAAGAELVVVAISD